MNMINNMKTITKCFAASAAVLLAANAMADLNEWTGAAGDNSFQNAGNWSLGRVPCTDDAGKAGANDDVLISGSHTVEYHPGGDFHPRGNFTVSNGAAWIQASGTAYQRLDGHLIIDGGTFDAGTSTGFVFPTGSVTIRNGGLGVFKRTFPNSGAAAQITVEGGTLRADGRDWATTIPLILSGGRLEVWGNLYFRAKFTDIFSGGVVQTGGELRLLTGGAVLIDGSTFEVGKINFTEGNGSSFVMKAGELCITNTVANGGIDGASAVRYVNFPSGGRGVLSVKNVAVENVYSTYFSGTTPKVRYSGLAVQSAAEFAGLFDVVPSVTREGYTEIMLKRVAGAATFKDGISTVTSVLSTVAELTATIDEPGDPAATLLACFGPANGGNQLDVWMNKVPFETVAQGETVSATIPVESDRMYYYALAASNESAVVFAPAVPLFFMTGEVGVEASAASVIESDLTGVTITVTRPAANNCTALELSVPFVLGGTAVKGTHFSISQESPVVIPAGAASATVHITPWPDPQSLDAHSVLFSLVPSKQYLLADASSVECLITKSMEPAITNVYRGGAANLSTSWSLGLPTADHVIYYSPAFTTVKELVWTADMTDTVAGWIQPLVAGSTDHYVTFNTTPQALLNVTGDVVLDGGHWRHAGPSAAPTTAVAVHVKGNLTVGVNASINAGNGVNLVAYGKPTGYAEAGPGYTPAVLKEQWGFGASYGGEGVSNVTTYGSVLNPLTYGSSGVGNDKGYAGGGLILLTVDGTTEVNGSIYAEGFGYDLISVCAGASSGGSVNLTTGRLLGIGKVSANGGKCTTSGSGSGGRVRIKLTNPAATSAEFRGTASAYGAIGSATYSLPCSAAGTVTWQTASDAADSGIVIVDNDKTNAAGVTGVMATHLPPMQDTDASLRNTIWVLRGNGMLRVTKNVTLQGLTVESASAKILTDGHVVSVRDFVVNGVKQKPGLYTAAEFPNLLLGTGGVNALGGRTVLLVQ